MNRMKYLNYLTKRKINHNSRVLTQLRLNWVMVLSPHNSISRPRRPSIMVLSPHNLISRPRRP